MALFPLPIAIPTAILSHYLIDCLGEQGYPKDTVKIEGAYLAIQAIATILSGHFWWLVCGFLMGNAVDIIDKIIKPKITGYANGWFACHRVGYPCFPLTLLQTHAMNVALLLFMILILYKIS